MARKVGDTFKVDVAIPSDIYELVVKMAEESDSPKHHKSGERVLTPSIVKLLRLGAGAIASNPEMASMPIARMGGSEDLGKLSDRIRYLEDRLAALASGVPFAKGATADRLEDSLSDIALEAIDNLKEEVGCLRASIASTASKEDISLLAARIEALESISTQTPEPAIRTVSAKSDTSGRIPFVVFCQEHGLSLSRGSTANEVKAVLSEAGLDDRYKYNSTDRDFRVLETASNG